MVQFLSIISSNTVCNYMKLLRKFLFLAIIIFVIVYMETYFLMSVCLPASLPVCLSIRLNQARFTFHTVAMLFFTV